MRPKSQICDWLKKSDQLEGENFTRWSTTVVVLPLMDTILIINTNNNMYDYRIVILSKFVTFLIGQKTDHKIKMIMVSLIDHVKGYGKGTKVILIWTISFLII